MGPTWKDYLEAVYPDWRDYIPEDSQFRQLEATREGLFVDGRLVKENDAPSELK